MAAWANMSKRLAARLTAHPRWCALVLGALTALGFEPLTLWPLTLLGLAGLLGLLTRAATWQQASLIGWLFGLGHFTIGNGWIATAFTYQAQMPGWLGWVAVVALALYLAVYPMLAALGGWLLMRGLDSARGYSLMLGFAGCWILAEWLRSWVFTGYAWNPLAMAALGGFARPGLAAVAPWLGTYALSGLIALLGGAWFAAWQRGKRDAIGAALFLVPAALFLLPAFGHDQREGHLPFTLVQPDIRQQDLDDPSQFEKQFVKTALLTLPRHPGEQRIVLWPESGVPDYLRPGYPALFYQQTTFAADPQAARQRIAQVVGKGSVLLTGAVDLEMRGSVVAGARNSVTALDDGGEIRGGYAKAHLVPYGEYLPLRFILEPLGAARLVPGSLDFWPGPGPRTLELGLWGRAGVQVCYEIVFSGQVVDRAHRPDYLFNPSNDGWFGTWGPPQHLAQARLRAIEEGLPVLRATTTGISAVIDADGVVRQFIPRHQAARLDGLVPPAHAPTLFARTGNALGLAWALVLLVLSVVASRRSQR